MLGVRLDKKLETKLNRYIKKNRQSKSECVKQALGEFLHRKYMEEWHDKRTLEAWRSFEEKGGIPAEEIFAYLDTWGKDDNYSQ